MNFIQDPDLIADMIVRLLENHEPCMIGRIGANELQAVLPFLNLTERRSPIAYIKGEYPAWWVSEGSKKRLHANAGFFPPTRQNIERFATLMIEDIRAIDMLGVWQEEERFILPLAENAELVRLRYLEPFWSRRPWTAALKDKKVLVVHPFAESIRNQYEKHLSGSLLFNNPETLPEFSTFNVIRSVQSIGPSSENSGFKDWFEALDYMKGEIDRYEYDVCLIGCGAYGFPLAAHIKRRGKKAVHLGGALQLLFGIKGKRWEQNPSYSDLIRDNWIRPQGREVLPSANNVEGGCYW